MKVTISLFALCLLSLWSTGGVKAYVSCPLPTDFGTNSSTCAAQCSSNADCAEADSSFLCCPSQACGQQCVQSLTIPYHPPILGCPLVDPDVVGTCEEDCSDCSDGELCCSNGCGHVCTTAVEVTPICQGIRDSYNGTSMPGQYIPRCSEDGSFTPAQCHGSTGYCWCVDPETGVPASSLVRFEMPQCSCVHNGVVHHIGEEFPDDCNTCTCEEGGRVSCTEIGCNPPDTEPSGFYSCPVIEEDTVGVCSEECSSDADCNSDQMCCSNGCGHTCMDPTPIPYIAPPLECPDTWDGPIICDIQECSDSTECQSSDQLCCANPCGSRVCTDGVPPPNPCTATVNSLSGSQLLGSYIPKCDESEGTFFPLQCWSHYCWCVEASNGKPNSEMKLSTDVGELYCSRCEYNGQTYNHGDVVESHGECSKSTCLGGEIITSDSCDTCEYQGKEYHHKEYVDECNLCICLDGAIACAASTEPCQTTPTQCVYNGVAYNPGDSFEGVDDCGTCFCTASVKVSCDGDDCDDDDDDDDDDDSELDDLAWWHSLLIVCGVVIAVLAAIALILFIIMVVLMRNNQFRHKKLRESPSETFEPETVTFKNGPPEAQSVELQVPVEDPEPVDT